MIKKKTIPKITKAGVKKNIEKANAISKFLSQNKYLLGTVVIGVAGYLVYNEISDGIDSIGSGVTDALAPIETDVITVDIKPNTNNTTINEEEAKVLAKSLLEAFNQVSFVVFGGTDEDKIAEVFNQIKNGDDYIMVFNAFGSRPWMTDGTPTHWVDKKFFSENQDLNHWLREELGSFWDKTLYNKVATIVADAGMIL